MAEIRPFERADLSAVSSLVRGTLPESMADEEIPGFLAATLLDDPWTDVELPSLVATVDGQIVGFIGSHVRRFRLDDREVRAVCPSHLTVAPDHRGGAAGALLLRRLLTAGQQFTYSETVDDVVARIWRVFGGHLDAARACDWMIVLRPVRWLGTVAGAGIRRRHLGREQVPVGAVPFQAAGRRLMRRAFPEPDADVDGHEVDSATIVEHLPEIARGVRLRVDYDEAFLDHTFGLVESQFGNLVRRMVRREGRPIGWYAYVADLDGVSRVLELSSTEREADAVLGELMDHARRSGSPVISGRLEPHLLAALRRRLAVLGFARQPVIHSHDPELAGLLATSDSISARLSAEWFAI
jgi:GNAT superfamily N-acetyltransferase